MINAEQIFSNWLPYVGGVAGVTMLKILWTSYWERQGVVELRKMTELLERIDKRLARDKHSIRTKKPAHRAA